MLTVEPKAFRALLFLLHNPQRLISKEELLNAVWDDAAVTEGSLTRCISLLRSRLGDDTFAAHATSKRLQRSDTGLRARLKSRKRSPSDLPSPDRSIPEDGSIVETLTAKGLERGLRASRHRWPLAATMVGGILASFALVPVPPSAAAEHHGIQPDHARWPSKSSRGNRRGQALFRSDVGAVITRMDCRGRISAEAPHRSPSQYPDPLFWTFRRTVPTFSFLPIPRAPPCAVECSSSGRLQAAPH